MDVAGEGEPDVGYRGLVAENERREERGRVETVDAEIGGRVAGMAVVIAPDELDLDGIALGPPAAELGQGTGGDTAGAGVEQVAEHDHPAGTGTGDRRVETVEIPPGGAAGDGDARRAERGGLAPVEVGHHQGAGAGPEERALREEPDGLAGELEVDVIHREPDHSDKIPRSSGKDKRACDAA